MKTPLCCLLVGLLPTTSVAPSSESLARAAARVEQIIAHRGSSIDRPENTLAALRRAIEVKADITEIDVRTSRDGVLVCLHDDHLARTTDGKGRVGSKTLAELKKLDAGSWFAAKWKGEPIPTLRDALMTARGKILLMLDLKETGESYIRAVAAEVSKHGDPARTLFGVRSLEQVRLLGKLLPQARQIGLVPTTADIEPFVRAGVKTIRLWPKWLNDRTLVPRVRKLGARLLLGTGKGTQEEVVPLLAVQPEILASDDPHRLRATLATIAARAREK